MDVLTLSESLIAIATKIESLTNEQRMQISRFLDTLEDENRCRIRTSEIDIPA